MSEIRGMVHLEAKFHDSGETKKPNKVSAYKTQWWDRPRIDISIPKRRNCKEEG